MNYKAYPNKKTMPSRKSRKGERSVIYLFNSTAAKKARKAIRMERRKAEKENAD
jgi:hypothetical protein